MTVAHILADKGREVVTVTADEPVAKAIRTLADKKIGAVLILDGDGTSIAGVLSERDVVRALAADGPAALDKPVSALMTRMVITCSPSDTMAVVMAKMTEGRFRHVPVLEGGRLVGLVSIGDVVKRRIAETEHEAEALREYIATG